ncbi:MAG: NAD-dependent epimerase/dehydratase family protein [Pirellulaceae bacterium]
MSNHPSSPESAPRDVADLEERLSRPTPYLLEAFSRLSGDIVLLGVGGKMGPTMARMARRAADEVGPERRILGVSRFTNAEARQKLENWRVETVAADLFEEPAVAALPEAENVVYLASFKFGAAADPAMTWATNCYIPALVCRRYGASRIAAFSTGNVYGLTPRERGGSRESDGLAPIGDYAMAAVGRERMFEFFSQRKSTPVALLRLNYATEMRYGVLVDLARQVHAGETIDLSMGYANVIWQADANAMALASLARAASPPRAINIAGPELLSVREVCLRLGELLDRPVSFSGQEGPDALLSDGSYGWKLFARPSVSAETLIAWTADWVRRGGESLGKPTHFESRDGTF